MKKIEPFEKAIEEKAGSLEEHGINATLFWAYRNSLEADNTDINFDEVIWDYDIAEIAKTLRENKIDDFTISSNFSGLITTLAEFEKHGFKMAGLCEVKSRYSDWHTGEHAVIPAIRMHRNYFAKSI